MRFQDFLNTLARSFGLSGLHVDPKGACLVEIAQLALLFEWDDLLIQGTILVSCEVCPLPVETRAVVLETMLMQNERQEATLSLHPEEEVIYLHQRIHPSIGSEALGEILQSFVAQANLFRALVPTLKTELSESQGIRPTSFKA